MSLKPAPASLRDLPRAPPGALPPAPGGYGGGLPPAPGRGGYAPPPGGGYGGGAPRPTTHLPPRGGIGGGGGPQHPTGLPPNLLALFEPRPPLEYMPPPARPKKTLALTGIAALVGEFEDPKRSEENDETSAAAAETSARVPVGLETRDARSRRIAREKKARHADNLQRQLETYDPKRDTNAGDTDPYKTLFVGRLSYDADEETLRREFETFGDVRTVTIPKPRFVELKDGDRERRHCGYAFVEFNREDDMKAAYRGANGRTIEGRRVVVDAERARAVPDWRPRRLGGGVGRGRLEKPKKGKKGASASVVENGGYRGGRDAARDDERPRHGGGSRAPYAGAGDRDRGFRGDRDRDRDRGARDDRRGRSDRGGYGDDGERFGYARGGSGRHGGYGRDYDHRGGYERDYDRRRDRGEDAEWRRDRGGDRGYERGYGGERDGGGQKRFDGYKRDRSPDDRRGGYDYDDRGKRARDDGYGAPPPPPAAPDSPEEGEL